MKLNRFEFAGIMSGLVLVIFGAVFFATQGIAYADANGAAITNDVFQDLCQVGIGIFAACDNSGGNTGGGTTPPVDPCTIFDQMGNLPPNCTNHGNGGGGTGGGDTGGGTGDGTTGGTDTGSGNSGGSGSTAAAGGVGGGGGGAWGDGRDAQGYFITAAATTSGAVLGEATSSDSIDASSTTTPETSCDVYVTAFLRFGGQNDADQVKRLQHVLKTFEGANVEEDGVFGTTTLDAVNAFQMKYASEILAPWNIAKSTGFVYLTTRKKLNEVYCDHGVVFPLTAEENKVIEKVKTASVPSGGAATENSTELEPVKVEVPTVTPATPSSPSPVSSPIRDFFRRLFNRGL